MRQASAPGPRGAADGRPADSTQGSSPGTRRVERIMGTAVGIAVRDPGDHDRLLDDAFAELRRIEAIFSTFIAHSDVSRIGRGELAVDDADPLVHLVLQRCEAIEDATDGWFAIRPGRPDAPPLDPSGFVKGWAVDEIARLLTAGGLRSFAVNAGGDVLAQGGTSTHPWRIGIRHPDDPMRVAAVLSIIDGAVATSGAYERGSHIWGRGGRDRRSTPGRCGSDTPGTPQGLRSATVVGPELGVADALATAVFASGGTSLGWLRSRPGHEVLLVDGSCVRWSGGLDRLLSQGASVGVGVQAQDDGPLGGVRASARRPAFAARTHSNL